MERERFFVLQIYWSQNGELVCLATEESFYVLRYNPQAVAAAASNKELLSEDGIEDAFDVRSRQWFVLFRSTRGDV